MTKVMPKTSERIPSAITDSRANSTPWQTTQVPPAELLIAAEAIARMKELIHENEVRYFPEGMSPEDQYVLVNRVQDGRLRVVDTDENLLRFLRWMSPVGSAARKVPVCVVAEARG